GQTGRGGPARPAPAWGRNARSLPARPRNLLKVHVVVLPMMRSAVGYHRRSDMIPAAFPYRKQRRRVLGSELAYAEGCAADPIVLLHGNPTSSSRWRNVLPHLQPRGRCIAPDLIGMGDSDKLPDSGPGSYRFVEHRRYLDALLEALD